MTVFHLHLVSDATGETLSNVARACLSQFDHVTVVQHSWPMVRSRMFATRVVEGIRQNPGLVLVTMVDDDIRQVLVDGFRELGVPYIPLLDPIMGAMANFLGVDMKRTPGLQHELNATYYARIDAIDFTMAHDDGQRLEHLEEADVVVVGVSRTSKTPTCMYLANRGLKAANVPLVGTLPPPPKLLDIRRPMVVGLSREPKSLAEIRAHRLRLSRHDHADDHYADPDHVREEVLTARRLCQRHGWPVIDMTHRSIEEAAAHIMLLHERHIDKKRFDQSIS